MRSGPNTRRPMRRGGGNNNSGGRWGGSPRSQSFESNGPDIKVRGNAQQIVDKYQALAREATTAGNPVMAENYYQHAEHYHRVLSANGGNENRQNNRQQDSADNRNNNVNGADSNQQKSNGQSVRENSDNGRNGSAAAPSETVQSSDTNAAAGADEKPTSGTPSDPAVPENGGASPDTAASVEAQNGSASPENAEKTRRRRAPRAARSVKPEEQTEASPSETVDPAPSPGVSQTAPESTDEGVKPVS